MSETQLTNYLGWLQEANYGVDPNQDTNQGYLLGKNVMGDFPRVKRAIRANHNNNYQPSENLPTTQIVAGNIAFEPVNCLALKYLFTKTDGTGITDDGGGNLTDGVRTIDPSAIAPVEQRASWAWRKDLGNSTENLRDHILGNVIARYQEGFNFIGGADQRLIAGMDYIGQRRVTPATDVSKPPIYPDNTANDSDNYKKDGNTILTYDGDNMLPQMVQLNWQASNEPQSHPVDGQRYVERAFTGNQTYGLTLNVRRAGGFSKQLHIDYSDQLDNDTPGKPVVFKIYNTDNDLYKKYTYTQCDITDMLENIVIDAQRIEHPTYKVTLQPLSMVPEFKDGLNKTTFYNLS